MPKCIVRVTSVVPSKYLHTLRTSPTTSVNTLSNQSKNKIRAEREEGLRRTLCVLSAGVKEKHALVVQHPVLRGAAHRAVVHDGAVRARAADRAEALPYVPVATAAVAAAARILLLT